MNIGIPFKVEMYPNYNEILAGNIQCLDIRRLDKIIIMIYWDLIGAEQTEPLRCYSNLVKMFRGTWIVVGTSEAWGHRGFVLIQPGRSVCVLPTIFCKVVENPIGEARSDDSKT